jgi:hypothetical protein
MLSKLLNTTSKYFVWDGAKLRFTRNGQELQGRVVKAATNATVTESRARLAQSTLKLTQQAAKNRGFSRAEVLAWEADAKQLLKALNGANAALARGGFNRMRRGDWEAAAKRLEPQFKAVERVAQRAIAGSYGAELQNGSLLVHVQNIANAARGTYEATRLDNAQERLGHDEFKRILGASDHCTSERGFTGCVEAAEMDWCSREEFIEIGDCTCHGNCNCVAVSRRSGQNERLGL